jgi:hypothetical protein
MDIQEWDAEASIGSVLKSVSSFARKIEPETNERRIYQHFVEDQALQAHHASLKLLELGQRKLSWDVRTPGSASSSSKPQAGSAEYLAATSSALAAEATSTTEVMIDSGASETVASPESLALLVKGLRARTGQEVKLTVVGSGQMFRLADGSTKAASSEFWSAHPSAR